jgi:hypothetical protein
MLAIPLYCTLKYAYVLLGLSVDCIKCDIWMLKEKTSLGVVYYLLYLKVMWMFLCAVALTACSLGVFST